MCGSEQTLSLRRFQALREVAQLCRQCKADLTAAALLSALECEIEPALQTAARFAMTIPNIRGDGLAPILGV